MLVVSTSDHVDFGIVLRRRFELMCSRLVRKNESIIVMDIEIVQTMSIVYIEFLWTHFDDEEDVLLIF